jgi:hypothetical protein
MFLFLITVQTLGKKKNPAPFSQIHFGAISLFCWFSVSVARLGLHPCADFLAPSLRWAQGYVRLKSRFLSPLVSHVIARLPPPSFFIMISHVNPSSSLNAVHFWVHSNVIVCCCSSLFFFFLSLTFYCQRF